MRNLIGTWRLVSGESVFADGTPGPAPYGGEGAIGRVTLGEDGRMAAVLCDGRTDIPAGEAREYTSYCGRWTFDGKTLITRVDACSDPARMGTDQIRDVAFENDRMILRPPTRERDGKQEHRRLVWEKIADV